MCLICVPDILLNIFHPQNSYMYHIWDKVLLLLSYTLPVCGQNIYTIQHDSESLSMIFYSDWKVENMTNTLGLDQFGPQSKSRPFLVYL